MNRRPLLACVAATQLASALIAMALALRRGHSFDVGFMHGHPDTIVRESVLQGTALSAPVTMLVAQGAAVAVLARRPSTLAVRVIGILGALNVPGYLSERLVRRRLSLSGWESLESPLLGVGISLAALMAFLAPMKEAS